MATKFYLPSSGSAPISAGFDDNWDVTSSMVRLPLARVKTNTAMTTISYTDTNNSNQDIGLRQWISEEMPAQTITAGAVQLQIRAAERISGNNLFLAAAVWITDIGGFWIADIWEFTRAGTELATSLTNRQWEFSYTEHIINQPFHLVIDIGAGGDPAQSGGADHDYDLRIGDSAASDLPDGNTSTDDFNPWLELSHNFTFYSQATSELETRIVQIVGRRQ